MLSEHKNMLRLAELVALGGSLCSLYVAVRLYAAPESDLPIELLFITGFALLMLSFLPACMLGGEYVRTVRRPTTYRQRTAGLDSKELSALLRWAPVAYKVVAALGVVVLAAAGVMFGSVAWSASNPPTPRDGIAGGLYLASFFSFALPLLASAARMPGTYLESCRVDA